MINSNQTEQQKKDLFIASQAGAFRDIALSRGGTGELRKPSSTKEKARRKKQKQTVKASRKANRG